MLRMMPRFAVLASLLLTTALIPLRAAAASVDRVLTVQVEVEGQQDWKNALQWSNATTRQRYEISTGLRSDGVLHAANLLEPDTQTRLAIKTEYLRQQGLKSLQAMGIDPASPDLQQRISRQMQKEVFECKGNPICMGEVNGKYAKVMAAAVEPDNSHLFEGEPRYRYFFDYQGCPNTIHVVHRLDVEGETAYGRKKDNVHPYTLGMQGDYRGSEQDRSSMCSYFMVVEDTVENQIYVENVYIPAAVGQIKRTEFGKSTQKEGELPSPPGLQDWVNSVVRTAPPSGESSATLPLTMPLDGNSTVLGDFTGQMQVKLDWAWK